MLLARRLKKVGFKRKDGKPIVPRYIQDMMSLILNVGNAYSHTTELSQEEIEKYDNYVKNSGGDSKLLIFSLALQFCEILHWANNYVKDHPNIEENFKGWEKIRDTKECGDDVLKSTIRTESNKGLVDGNYYEGKIVEVVNERGTFFNIQNDQCSYKLRIITWRDYKCTRRAGDVVLFKAVRDPNNESYYKADEVHLKEREV